MTTQDAPGTAGGDVGVVGWFDRWSFDTQLRRVVVTAELARRAPSRVRVFAPYGSIHPQPWLAGAAVEALVPCSAVRTAELATELAVVVAVGDLRTPDISAVAAAMPQHPAPSVDDLTAVAEWIAGTAIPAVADTPDARPGAHPGLLADRVWPAGVCAQRREFLRAMQWWPAGDAPVVVALVDADGTADGSVPAAPHHAAPVVRFATGHRSFLDRVSAAADGDFVIDPQLASLDDLVAAIAGATSVITDDPAVAAVAVAHHRPVELHGAAADAGPDAVRALDDHFDAIAARIAVPRSTTTDAAVIAARAASETQARNVAHERIVLADHVAALRNELELRTAERDALRARTTRARLARFRATLRSARTR